MGRDWHWGSGAAKTSKKLASERESAAAAQTTSIPGCITAVFHLFDFHHFHFPLNHQTSSSATAATTTTTCSCFKPDAFLSPHPTSTTLKGAEAPRNSLESEEEASLPASAASLLASTSKDEENLNIPMSIQIKTSGDARSRFGAPINNYEICCSSSSSEISCSPAGTKTPTLVARLMGLDLLPESRSPAFSSLPKFGAKPQPTLNLNQNIPTPTPKAALQSKTITSHHRNSFDGTDHVISRGSRSLPETPRISSARRSDVDHHHRLSLQINKENMSASEELVLSRLSTLKRKELKHESDTENRSPGHYARQIVKQVKESVSRKVGMDITNTVGNREVQAREELVSQFKYKKISRASTKGSSNSSDDSSPGKHSAPSCSPRLRFLESKNKQQPVINTVISAKDHNTQPPKPILMSPDHEINIQPQPQHSSRVLLPKPKLPLLQPVEEEEDNHEHHKQKQKEKQPQPQPPPRAEGRYYKKGLTSEKQLGSRLKKPQQTSDIIRNKQEEPFVRPSATNRVNNIPDKKCRKTPLSNDLLNISVPTLLPVKKDPSPPATKIPQKQVSDAQRSKRSSQLSSCSSQTYKKQEETTHVHVAQDDNNGNRCKDATSCSSTTGDEAAEEYEYIARILRRTGLEKDTPVSFFTTPFFSPSQPLHPSIFYYLEHLTSTTTCSPTHLLPNNKNTNCKSTTQLTLRCNRKLLFHLVDEILGQILKPNYFSVKPWAITVAHDGFRRHMNGSQLIDTLCTKIRSFPQADCRDLEDIDALIDKDLPEMNKVQRGMAYEEEGEGIVTEIEKDIFGSLVHETAVFWCTTLNFQKG